MRHKSESFEKFKEFKNEVQNQLGKNIKALRSDRGGEYLSQDVVESESVTQGPRRSGRIRHAPERYGFLITDDKGIVLVDHNEPTTY